MSQENKNEIAHAFSPRRLRPLVAAFVLALVAACGIDDEFQRIADEANTGYVEGRSESSSASEAPGMQPMAEVSGEVAVAGRIDSSGTFVEKGRADVDASGHYRIGVDVSDGAISDLIVRIESGGEKQGSVIVAGSVRAMTTVEAAPINTETTVEAEAYASARSEGHWEEREGSSTLLRAHINADVAAEVHGGSQTEADILALGQAASASIKAYAEAFLDADVGVTEAELESALTALTDARASLDAALHAAADAEAEAEAHASFEQAAQQAYEDASITLEQQSRAAQSSAEAFLLFAGELSTEARAHAQAEAEKQRATTVSALVEAQVTAAEVHAAGETAMEAAIEQLHADVEAAAVAGSQAEADIRTAWQDFSAAVIAELKASMDATQETAFESAESIAADAQSALDDALSLIAMVSVEASASASVSAFLEGYSAITADSTVQIMVDAGMEQARAEAVIEILAAVSLAAR